MVVRVHKNIGDDETYLPFATSKLRQLAKTIGRDGRYAAQKFFVDDGTTIQISVKGDDHHITITTPVRYEFFTSEHINDETLASPGFEGLDGSLSFVQGSMVRADLGAQRKTTPVFSHVLTPGADESWRVGVTTEAMPNKTRGSAADSGFTVNDGWPISHGAWQDQKGFEYTNWPMNGNKSLVTSTQCMAPGMNNQSNYMSAYFTERLANVGAFVSDYGLDVAPVYYDSKGSSRGGPLYESPDIWWRHAAVQIAGGRKFFICTDNMGRFQVYPVKDYATLLNGAQVPPEMYKLYVPPYPAWVTLPVPGSDAAVQTNSWLWAFNKDATKAVSCPFHSVRGPFFKDTILPVAGRTFLAGDSDLPASALLCREDIPGLVEFEIVIAVTGPGDMDFDTTFTLGRTVYSGDADGRYIFDAAYSLKDKGASQQMGIEEDTLVTAEVVCFTAPGGYEPGPVPAPVSSSDAALNGPGPESIQAARRVEGFLVISGNDASLQPTEILRRKMSKSAGQRCLTEAGVRRARLTLNQPYLNTFFDHEVGPSPWAAGVGVSFPPPVDGPGGWLGFIFSMELRTLSLHYGCQDQIAGTVTNEFRVYNEVVVSNSGPFGTPASGPFLPCTEKIPSSATYVHLAQIGASLNTSWFSGLNIHPAGHWSYSTSSDGGEGTDMIHVHGRDLASPLTHKDIFNAAFGQSRDYDFYQHSWNPATRLFTDPLQGIRPDLGSFRTNGVWITF